MSVVAALLLAAALPPAMPEQVATQVQAKPHQLSVGAVAWIDAPPRRITTLRSLLDGG